ncbi:unnamed protein product [Rotaria magnacalcarata]|uniref:G-patch domain-containing protein n=4 Tax=Rotaria magnacalcarata TaxID=392030 RepID=A0A815CEG3_9BILA|nr:unnamed protein product [Rotaria magnacalcarata]CAF3916339.1 unnamed protein product [Rotaria magnacalcarata]CAF3979697.1 unnamed protein product [Rotaria magnacalcarata]
MDDTSHVFLIKDKIRCIQKKIMDQLAADLNSALNDANILTSPLSNVPLASSSSFSTSLKIKRRRKRPVNNESQQQKTEASDSTTPENSRNRLGISKQSASDGDDLQIPSKTQSSSLIIASESDSASQTDDMRRRRRPFKKPIIPSASLTKLEQPIKLIRCSSMKVSSSTIISTTTINANLNHRCQNCRSTGNCRKIDTDDDPSAPSSASSFSLAIANINCNGKRKRSRAIIHDDFRLRTNSVHDYDMTCGDDPNLTNISSDSSLNLSDSDKDPCLTSNEADDEQSDWPRDESSIPRCLSWKEGGGDNNAADDDDDEKMLTTNEGTLDKIVSDAFNMVLHTSKDTIKNRIKSFVNREMLTGNRRNASSKNNYAHPHLKRHVRLLKETRRSHHNSYNHKRVKSEHYPPRHHDIVAPIDSTNIGHQLLEKIGWTPGSGLGLNQDGITAPVDINYHNCRQGLGYDNTSIDTIERMESEHQPLSSSSHPSHV